MNKCEYCYSDFLIETSENITCTSCSRVQNDLVFKFSNINQTDEESYLEKNEIKLFLAEIQSRYNLSSEDVNLTLEKYFSYKVSSLGVHSNMTVLCYSFYSSVGVNVGYTLKKVCEMFLGSVSLSQVMKFKTYITKLKGESTDECYTLKKNILYVHQMLRCFNKTIYSETCKKALDLKHRTCLHTSTISALSTYSYFKNVKGERVIDEICQILGCDLKSTKRALKRYKL